MEKIRFGGRILRAGAESAALPAGDRSKPDLSQVELDAQLFKAEVRLNNEVLEDSVERGQLRQTIMQLMAEAISRDIDEVIIRGDTTSPDPFLAKLNGILKQATSNIVDAQNQSTNKGIFRRHAEVDAVGVPAEQTRDALLHVGGLRDRLPTERARAAEPNVAQPYESARTADLTTADLPQPRSARAAAGSRRA